MTSLQETPPTVYLQTIVLGALTAGRSMLPLALVSQALRQRRAPAAELNIPVPVESATGPLAIWLGNPWVARVLTLAALGELVGDKLPNTPNRTELPPLIGRAVLGGVAGAGLWQAQGRSPLVGAAIAGASAFANTYSTFLLRAALAKRLPAIAAGFVEDGLVLAGTVALLPKARARVLTLRLW